MQDFSACKVPVIAGAEPKLILQKREIRQIVLVMKMAAVLLLVATLNVSGRGWAQEKITLSATNAPLETVFNSIRSQTGVSFFYRPEYVKNKKVTIKVTNATLTTVLDVCLKGQDLTYEIVGKIVGVHPPKKDNAVSIIEINANTPLVIDVHGRVVNETGDPIPDVTVTVKGSSKNTLTDKNGEFSISTIDQNAVLVFTHISLETFELKVSGKSELAISLKTKVSALKDVVISVNTGYQQISRERFIGSFSQLDSIAYQRRAGMDIISRLDGNVTGILFDKKSGNNTRNIQIRGLSTLTDLAQSAKPDPLIIVDNFPFKQDLSTINPNDVENITVLKDAAAASIWGAQAGNGVIVITTKKGRYNQPMQIALSSNVTIQEKPDLYYYPQIDIADFVDAEQFLFNKGFYDADLTNTNSWPVISPVVEMLDKRRSNKLSALDSAAQINAFKNMDLRRDLDKYVYRHAILQQHYINLMGGNNQFNYNVSGGYNRTLNNIQNSKPDDQYTINANLGFRPIKGLEINTRINYSQSEQRSTSFNLPGKMYPYAQLADAEGNPLALPNHYRMTYLDTAGGGKLLDWKQRPMEEITLANNVNVAQFIMLNMGITYAFTSWLNATVTYQYTKQASNGKNYYSPETYFTRDLINTFTNLSQTAPAMRNPITQGGILETLNTELNTANARGQINFNKRFGLKHRVTALVAAETSETKGSGNGSRFYGYNKEIGSYNNYIDYSTFFPLYISGSGQIPNGNNVISETNNRFVSFLANGSYTFNDRYTMYASARKDGSNMFGVNTNRKWKPLWSAGASWDISQEGFYNADKWLSMLRLRASYGFSGNPGNATGFPTISYVSSLSSLANLVYASPNDPPNPDLKWEKVRTVNLGIDFSLLKNRLSGTIDIWNKRSTDIISGNPLAPSTGNSSFVINIASLKGKGFDLDLKSINTNGAFKWQTGLGLSYARTIVTKLYGSRYLAYQFTSYGLNPAEGRMVYGIGSYKWEGLDPATGYPQGHFNKQVSQNYSAIYNDSIGNAVFNGSSIPLYYGFLKNSFSWKNFTLSCNITYRFDFYFKKPAISYSDLATNWNGNSEYSLRWKEPGDEKKTNVPSFAYPLDAQRDLFYQNAEINVLRGDNIRLNDLHLQYAWNTKKMKIPFKYMALFFYANNLNVILWRKNKSDLDPDFVGGNNFTAPTPKTWTGGINLNF